MIEHQASPAADAPLPARFLEPGPDTLAHALVFLLGDPGGDRDHEFAGGSGGSKVRLGVADVLYRVNSASREERASVVAFSCYFLSTWRAGV